MVGRSYAPASTIAEAGRHRVGCLSIVVHGLQGARAKGESSSVYDCQSTMRTMQRRHWGSRRGLEASAGAAERKGGRGLKLALTRTSAIQCCSERNINSISAPLPYTNTTASTCPTSSDIPACTVLCPLIYLCISLLWEK